MLFHSLDCLGYVHFQHLFGFVHPRFLFVALALALVESAHCFSVVVLPHLFAFVSVRSHVLLRHSQVYSLVFHHWCCLQWVQYARFLLSEHYAQEIGH